jgi:toxin HigB-1
VLEWPIGGRELRRRRGVGQRATALLFAGGVPRGIARELAVAARRKLAAIDAAERLEDLRIPPGNRLEALRGDRAGQHAIRVNAQWHIVFMWRDDGAQAVEIVDYL